MPPKILSFDRIVKINEAKRREKKCVRRCLQRIPLIRRGGAIGARKASSRAFARSLTVRARKPIYKISDIGCAENLVSKNGNHSRFTTLLLGDNILVTQKSVVTRKAPKAPEWNNTKYLGQEKKNKKKTVHIITDTSSPQNKVINQSTLGEEIINKFRPPPSQNIEIIYDYLALYHRTPRKKDVKSAYDAPDTHISKVIIYSTWYYIYIYHRTPYTSNKKKRETSVRCTRYTYLYEHIVYTSFKRGDRIPREKKQNIHKSNQINPSSEARFGVPPKNPCDHPSTPRRHASMRAAA